MFHSSPSEVTPLPQAIIALIIPDRMVSGLLASTLFILVTAYGADKTICTDPGYARPLPDFLSVGGMY